MSWTRSLGILALCGSLLFGLFSIVPSGRGSQIATKPIEAIRVGDRVLVDAPDEAIAADFARLNDRELSCDQTDGSFNLAGASNKQNRCHQATKNCDDLAAKTSCKVKATMAL